jgi:GNAT superfamily N-acetyltransferase
VKVRDLSYREIEPILRLGCSYQDNRNIPGGLETSYYVDRFLTAVNGGIAHIFGMFAADGKFAGALGFFVVPDIFNGALIASQNFWYILPEYRGRAAILLKEYEKRARALKCTRMQMPHQVKRQSADFGKFFERFGFEMEEVSYYKTLL